ncbi:SMP-30/gluconolactonase/LRE family protein [Rhodobacter sp. Har01]|uniref:SMP-30/gluconolactonase/LRE family protein n=1 Tax=Rhodobacter sp. Har01 TaxID=2883999 RepID=UPI001D08F1D2|nr:SMP-30/gluconolactonase/LRE family protein [Rhodobacter sp. Har01]MCB6179802.1 SMP-30/gluconolactonase/LRE family protein [Rhodobacter sp. Har01]
MIWDDRPCDLGEGAFWHPLRRQFYWFDILHGRLLTRDAGGPQEFRFPEMVSTMGWINADEALVAAESGLLRVNLNDGSYRQLARIEAGQPATRSNDGRADRQGGFWWGTMGTRGGDDPGLGAIWRFYRGEVRRLFPGLTIPNAICFTPDGTTAQFTDTLSHKVMRVALDVDGWPVGEPRVWLDLTAEGLLPDGCTIDAEGYSWLAQWGAGRVACYGPDGTFLRAVEVAAPHSSCPAFGGVGMDTLFITSAREGMSAEALAACPDAGRTFATAGVARGLPEPQVIA